MSLTRAGYTKDWNNPSDFPTIETSETQVRLDIQDLYDQIRDDVNVIAGELESTTSGSSGASNIGTSLISGVSGTNVQAMLADLKSQISGAIADAYTKAQADAKFETIVSANNLINNVTFNSANGQFTFTFQDATKTPLVIDTNLELIPGYITLVEDPVGSGTYYMAIYTKDPAQGGILISRCPVSALFNPIAVQDTTTIDLTLSSAVAGVKTLSASVKTGSIGEEHLTTEYKATLEGLVDEAEGYKDDAEAAATNSANSATESSGYATTAGGYATAASGSATDASGYATSASGYATQASGYATNASNSANQSSGYATTSQQKATLSESYAKGGTGARTGEDTDNAKYYKEQTASALVTCQQKATLSESWAVGGTGTRTGEDTNNAKYWAEQASILATGDMKKSVFDPTGTVESAGGISSFVGQEISVKENTSNKVTAFQSVPDDAHYPSEKLVKDSLDTKIEHIECFVQNDTLYLVGEIFQVSGTTLIIS